MLSLMCTTAQKWRACIRVLSIVWRRETLVHMLLPVWERLYNLGTEAEPFKLPVDPVAVGIPVSLMLHTRYRLLGITSKFDCEVFSKQRKNKKI